MALAVTYVALVVLALVAHVRSRGIVWWVAALVLVAWGALLAGHSLWLQRFGLFMWWGWINVVVLVHLGMTWTHRARKTPATSGGLEENNVR